MKPLTVLHCFGTYLSNTENWAFRLVRYLPNCDRLVTADRFLDCDFYLPEIEYLRRPLSSSFSAPPGFQKVWRWVETIFAKMYFGWRLRGRRVDVVHSHFANVGWRYQHLARRLGAVHVVSFYGLDYEHLPTIHPEWKSRMAWLFVEADLLLCEGPHGAKVLAKLGCPVQKIRVCQLGVEADNIPFCRREKSPGGLRLLQVASFREKKGHVDSVRAFAKAAVACPSATMTLVGGGEATVLAEVRGAIADARLEERVRIIAGIDFSRLYDFMRDYDVFIHPSVHTPLKDCEGGAPIVLLDAQATGMPVISTLHCDIPEEVVDESTGLLVSEHDIDGLSAAITRFYNMDQAEYDGFSSRGRAHVVDNFDARNCSARVYDVYLEAMAKVRKSAHHAPP